MNDQKWQRPGLFSEQKIQDNYSGLKWSDDDDVHLGSSVGSWSVAVMWTVSPPAYVSLWVKTLYSDNDSRN